MKFHSISFPKEVKITNRTSTMRGAFIKAIIPTIIPSEEEIAVALEILKQDKNALTCSYCGDKASEWEHFRPIVNEKSPTGYVTDIYNMVPSCGKCNQSKSGEYWKTWMLGDAKYSPKTRGIEDLDERIKYLEEFEAWGNKSVHKMPESFLQGDKLKNYLKSCENFVSTFKKYQSKADRIKAELSKHTKKVKP